MPSYYEFGNQVYLSSAAAVKHEPSDDDDGHTYFHLSSCHAKQTENTSKRNYESKVDNSVVQKKAVVNIYELPADISKNLDTIIKLKTSKTYETKKPAVEVYESPLRRSSQNNYEVLFIKANDKENQKPLDLKNGFGHSWKKGMQVGNGAFGVVYQALIDTGAILALKQIELEELDENEAQKEYENIKEEVNILSELDHENVVKFMGTSLEQNCVNIFMEYITGGTIESLLKTFGALDETLLQKFLFQIVKGVVYIHSKKVIHRDIKGRNIMLMQNGCVKLIDFGCSKRVRKNQSENSTQHLLKSLKGTPFWMAPEVIKQVGYNSKADIWSVGCTAFEMATGKPPWNELNPIAAIYAIGNGDTELPKLPSHFSDNAREFVEKCLVRDPNERPTAEQLLSLPFFGQLITTV